MHAHTSKTRASALGLYVVNGVTTIRDQGSEHAEVLRWRREIRAGTRVGPRMLIAGPYLESRNNIERMRRDPPESRVEPFERARIPIGSPDDARRVIDSLARLERYQEAEPYLKEEIRFYPSHVRARAGLAMLYQAMGRTAEAESTLDTLVRDVPSRDASDTAARVWRMFGRPDKAAAVDATARRPR